MRRNCLEPDELRRVLEGELPPEQFDSAISHLDTCETCRTAAERFDGGLQAVGESKSSEDDARAGVQNETACQVALQQLLQQSSAILPATAAPPPPFEMLGPYRLLELIGSGGMGAVYLAEHQRLKRRCAIKLLPPERVTQAGWLDRFDREMTTIASLEHPHIVCATDAGHEAGWHYLVMEYLDGLDIGRVAGRIGQLDVADACEIVRQAALGLAHIHDSGLVHRDIKPSNLMLTQSGTIKLLDLGLVLDGDDPLAKDDRLTTVGHVMGTMPYMAPEQLADSRDVRPQSDMYSLGATLYRLIAGHPPHRSERGLAAQVLAITSSDAKPLDAIRNDVDRDVVSFVASMLSRDPAKRPASAMEVARQLESMTKPSHLKRLLRDAVRKHSADDLPRSTLLPSIVNSGGSKDRVGIKRWLMGAAAALCLIAATIVIKIQTDRGDLVIHSEHDDLTVLVKQGDEVVDQLTIESGKDNRKTLHKGTYQVEIVGGGDALALSDDVVTIGRGTGQSIDVVKRIEPRGQSLVEAPTPSLDSVRAEDLDPGIPLHAVRGPGVSPAPNGSVEIPAGSAMDFASFGGKSLSHWIEQIRTETEMEPLGEAIYAAIGGLQDLSRRSMSNASESEVVVKALLERAREFGGLNRKLPPLPGMNDQAITPSEHFMWCLTEVFAEPSFDVWYESSVQELIEGNVNSRAAVITCLHRRVRSAGGGGMYGGGMGGGGMGGFGGGYPGAAMDGTISKFTTNKLIRCCLSLATADAWSGMPVDQQKGAATRTREVLIVMPGSLGMGLSQEANDELTRVILSIPESERSDWEKGFVPNDAGDPTDSDGAAMEGYGMQSLGAAQDESADSAPETLFQGRDLASWMEALERERDVASLGEAMRAVETLSREADTQTRLAAANKTLSVARRLGGIVAGGKGDPNPSHSFMSSFLETFPRYCPNPGIDAIRSELSGGNTNSQTAAVWVLYNYLQSTDAGFGTLVAGERSDTWIKDQASTEQGREYVRVISDELLNFVDSLAPITPTANLSFSTQQHVRQLAMDSALHLSMEMDDPIAENERLRRYVVVQVASAMENKTTLEGQSLATFGQSKLKEQMLVAAIQVAQHDKDFGTSECWDFLATHFSMPADVREKIYWTMSDRYRDAFDRFKKAAPKSLLNEIHRTLNHPGYLSTRSDWYVMVIPFYADEFNPVEDAAKALQFFESSLDSQGPASEKLRTVVETAQQMVRERIALQSLIVD
ncbi:serine/threonine protein kinase [Stieleria neptunia]|nr:serine/threonine-protein kinase [Stieleria neptunia]